MQWGSPMNNIDKKSFYIGFACGLWCAIIILILKNFLAPLL